MSNYDSPNDNELLISKTLRRQLEVNDENEASLKHCLSEASLRKGAS